jgi:Cu2+-exporting ATPase
VAPEGEIRLGSRAFCGIANAADDGTPELWLARPGAAPARCVFAHPLRRLIKDHWDEAERARQRS